MSETTNNSNSMAIQIEELTGTGEAVRAMVGFDSEKGEIITETFYIAPVALKDIPKMAKALEDFMSLAQDMETEEQTLATLQKDEVQKKAAEIIHMSVSRFHPDLKIEEIENKFTLGALGRVVRIAMDVNDFFTQMVKIEKMAKEATQE